MPFSMAATRAEAPSQFHVLAVAHAVLTLALFA
jgi:hypothetical protein